MFSYHRQVQMFYLNIGGLLDLCLLGDPGLTDLGLCS